MFNIAASSTSNSISAPKYRYAEPQYTKEEKRSKKYTHKYPPKPYRFDEYKLENKAAGL